MVRLFVDKQGALGEKGGNAAGQLFLDAHFGYHNYERYDRAGYNVGIGYEFSLSKDFNFGPYFRFAHVPIGDGFSYMSASFGIQASVGGKFEPDDADKDGIEDSNDLCPLAAEDIDGFEDGDGCFEEDNDRDSVLDQNDDCPDVAGVASNRGCPENDNDHDGILNETDDCPDAAEDNDNFEDEDGCPDNDNDQDGILDAQDKCPLIPETKNELDDTDGCPDFVRLNEDRIELLDAVYFGKNKAVVLDRSLPMLEEAAALLTLKTEMMLRIEAHTDNTLGKKASQKLSAQRAEAVKTFFVTAGIDSARLTATGLGQETPIDDNKTKAGRAKNDRIELLIQQPEAPTPAVETAPVPAE
jgi:outer membrane protein OmpA-like peptidoglycan-associated protein